MRTCWNLIPGAASYLSISGSSNGNAIKSMVSNPRVVRVLAIIAALYYLIPDIVLMGFFSYNVVFNRDKVVWLKAQYGLQLGVTLGLRMYVVPLVFALVQLLLDLSLMLGFLLEKHRLASPGIIFHAGKCVLSAVFVILFQIYLPQITVILAAAVGSVPVKTITISLLCFLGLELLSWSLAFTQFRLMSKKIEYSRLEDSKALFGSQPNITRLLDRHSPSASKKQIAKTQSFKHQKGEGTPKFLKKFAFRRKEPTKKQLQLPERIAEDRVENFDRVGNSRDVTTAVVDHRGAILVNEYWGVKLEIPERALKEGVEQEVYFVITDPRLCENSPPLDLENGETMLSPLVMCGPQGIEFDKPVVLHIPHYANTLPSLSISLKATDSESDVRTEWDNILLPSNHAANSVAVKVDHF